MKKVKIINPGSAYYQKVGKVIKERHTLLEVKLSGVKDILIFNKNEVEEI